MLELSCSALATQTAPHPHVPPNPTAPGDVAQANLFPEVLAIYASPPLKFLNVETEALAPLLELHPTPTPSTGQAP